MDEFRLEDLWVIMQGLLLVVIVLFSGMALIALWPRISGIAAAVWHRYVLFTWDEFLLRVEDRRTEALEGVNNYQEDDGRDYTVVMSPIAANEARTDTNERTNERTDDCTEHADLWSEFLVDRTRARLIAVMVDSDMSVTEIRALLKGESAVIGQEVEQAKSLLGKPASQPYQTPIAGRATEARYRSPEPSLDITG